MKRISFILAMLLALTCGLMPMGAMAESSDTEYNLVTITFDSLTADMPSVYSGTLPIDLKLSFGMDGTTLDTLRALLALDFGFDGEHLLTLESALEENAVKLHISGMSQDISIPMNQALEELLSTAFLSGLPLSEAPVEFMEAFGDFLAEINTLASGDMFTQSSEMPEYYIYSEEDWRSFFVEYPARMRAVPAGEEEIVFEGKTYTARKYTYHVDHLTYEEYEEYRNGLLMTNEEYRISEAATAGLTDALNRMSEIGFQYYQYDLYCQAAESDSTQTDIMTFDEFIDTRLSEDPYEGYFFSEEGSFYLIDEVMGTLETGKRTIHYPDNTEYVESVEFMSYLTDTQLIMETISSASTGSTREVNSVTIGEDGTITVSSIVESNETSSYDDFSYTVNSSTKVTEVISETGSVGDEEEIYTIIYTTDGVTDTQSTVNTLHSEYEYLSDTLAKASFSSVSSASYGGETSESTLSADITVELSILPEDTLLRVSGKPFNPLDATEAELEAYSSELSELITNITDVLIPSIETPSSVGGALLG